MASTQPSLQEIENKIDDFLLLPDKGILKLLFGFVLSCRLPIPPLWLFIASGSSNGKTELLNLLVDTPGYEALDDLTSNSLLSGMKRFDQSASLLDRMPKEGGYLVFKDFTTMLSKHKEELASIMGKLRVIYDGSYNRKTGGLVEEKNWEGKLSMLAAGTTTIYSKTEEFAEMGPRAVIYHLEGVDDYEVSKFLYARQKKDRKAQQKELQQMVAAYVAGIEVPKKYDELPPINREVWEDLTDIAHLASTARSPVERDRFSRDKTPTFNHDKEGFGRLFGQLKAAAYGLMLQNPGAELTNTDRKLLYKLGLDCIDQRRRKVLQALTRFSFGGDYDQIADATRNHKDTASIAINDLLNFGMVERQRSGGKYVFRIVDRYRTIMQKFENITPEEKAIPVSGDEQGALVGLVPPPERVVAWDELIK